MTLSVGRCIRLLALFLMVIGMTALLPVAASTQGKSESAHRCRGEGYLTLTDANGNPFTNVGDCVSYFAQVEDVDNINLTRCLQQAEDAGLDPDLFDILVGTDGDDYWDQYTGTDGGRDLYCGLDGHDGVLVLRDGDIFIGGLGNDSVEYVGFDGNVTPAFYGGAGDDVVGLLRGGTFFGGEGNDAIEKFMWPGTTFYGGAGNDVVANMSGGTFHGEDGDDSVTGVILLGGTFIGGNGLDSVGENRGGTFIQDFPQ